MHPGKLATPDHINLVALHLETPLLNFVEIAPGQHFPWKIPGANPAKLQERTFIRSSVVAVVRQVISG